MNQTRVVQIDGESLVRLRKANGLNQAELAKRAGVSIGTVHNAEKSAYVLLYNASRLAESLGVRPYQIQKEESGPLSPRISTELREVTLKIPTPLNELHQEKLQAIIFSLAELIHATDIPVRSVTSGSTIIKIVLTLLPMVDLLKCFVDDQLDILNIEEIAIAEFAPNGEIIPNRFTSLTKQGWKQRFPALMERIESYIETESLSYLEQSSKAGGEV